MAEQSLTHLISLINQQVDAQEKLNEHLAKAEALAQITITTEFLELSESIIYNHLWALSDIISQAKDLNEQSLSILLSRP
jgi:hypothetical protein